MAGRLPGCRRSGEVTRLRRLMDQHSGGGTGVNARRVSAAGLWHMGFCTCVGYVCLAGDVAGDGRRIRSDLGDGWLDSVENRSVGETPGDLWIIHSLFVHRREPV